MSSYDIAVWHSPADFTDVQAAEYYRRLSGHIVVVEHQPEFDAFLRELTAHFPDRPSDAVPLSVDDVSSALLTTFDDLKMTNLQRRPTPDQIAKSIRDGAVFESSPWGATLSANGDTMSLPFRWSTAETSIPAILAIARQHGLTIYDTQTGRVTNPDRQPTQSVTEFLSVHLTLRIAGQPPAVDVTLIQDDQTVLRTVMPNRAAAHAEARRVAMEHHDRAYEVVDPRSLAQGTRFATAPPDQSLLPPDMFDALRKQGFTIQTLEGPDGPIGPSIDASGATPPKSR